MTGDKSLVERLRARADYHAAGRWPAKKTADGQAAAAIERLTRERDKARAALASARNDALEEAAVRAVEGRSKNPCECGGYGCNCGNYGDAGAAGYDAACETIADVIRLMKTSPVEGHGFQTTGVAGHEGAGVKHKGEDRDD
jgi:hypothetical protein